MRVDFWGRHKKKNRKPEVNRVLEFGTDNEEITKNCSSAPFLLSINDDPDNQLVIVIALARRGEKGADIDMSVYPNNNDPKLREMLMNSYPVYEDMDQVYEIRFETYILYQCRNESYTCMDKEEVRKGEYLLIFEKSKLLDYYENVIFDFDFDDRKANRKHYGVYTENHIIDVISNKPPIITKPNPDSAKS